MNRYYIKFKKEGYIRYTSHLDLLRFFKRSFKRANIKLQYSQGFNPHPKMSFAQPLSLGYESDSEYLEFETIEQNIPSEIIDKLNKIMPDGIEILLCEEMPAAGKTLAALTESAEYQVLVPLKNRIDINAEIAKYLSQNKILVSKIQKKSGKELEINIRTMIRKLTGKVFDNYIMLTLLLDSGSISNLSPETVIYSFCEFLKLEYERPEIIIKRTGIFFAKYN